MGRSKQAPKRQRVDGDNSQDRPTPTESSSSSSSFALDALFRDSHVRKDQREAIEALMAAPADAVEAAAAEATRILIETWPRIDALVPTATLSHSNAAAAAAAAAAAVAATTSASSSGTTPTSNFTTGIVQQQVSLPLCFEGLAKWTLSREDFEVLQDFHQTIQERAQEWTSWSGSPIDPRRRVFGFLPNSFLGLSAHSREDYSPLSSNDEVGSKTLSWNWRDQIDVTMPLQQQSSGNENSNTLEELRQMQQEAPEKERQRNARAMVSLGENGDKHWMLSDTIQQDTTAKERKAKFRQHQLRQAIANLLDAFRPHAPPTVQPYLSLPNLVAAQPNLHCGRHLLPAHVDHPLKDGFGICIITIAMKGNAQIFLEESSISSSRSSHEGEAARGVMSIHSGQAYLLSGPARNQCTHGVLAHDDCSDRESLNLRFGLHGVVLRQSENALSKDNCRTNTTSTNEGTATKAEVISPDEVLHYW
jgi:hypothetical protein